MGWLGPGLTFPVSCMILVWAAGSGSGKVLHQPACFSDYISTSTCEWRVDGPTNCSAELRLTYQLDFLYSENHTCVPENRGSTVCLCDMLMDNVISGDTYQLDLWAGTRLLWSSSFKPSEHVKPRAPLNLTVNDSVPHTWQLTWSNPYPPENFLYSKLSYQVAISNEADPTEVTVHNVTYREPTLHLPAHTLKPGVFYSARVKAWIQSFNSTWSEWSPSVKWLNNYEWSWQQHLPLAVAICCVTILVICVSCYFSILRIKREWWDRIPNPAHSPLVAIVIQDSQVPLWKKRSGGQEPAKCPHWKTCLTKLLPCLLEHDTERSDSSSKAARKEPLQGPGKLPWCPVAVSTTLLSPESISVVKCVELAEAPVESEEEEEEEEEVEQDAGSCCPSPESSRGSFQDSREGIAARLTESLFLDLLRAENGGFGPQGLGESCLLPPSESGSAPMLWAELPREEPFNPESTPPATLTQRPACPAFAEMSAVVTDNPSYRSFSDFLGQSSGAGELSSDAQPSECPGDGDPNIHSAPQPSEPPTELQTEPETWEQTLRRSVLQHRAAAAPAAAPTGGYREFVCAVKQGSASGGGSSDCGPSGGAGYKAFSSLLASGATCPGTSGVGASSGEGCYRPFQSITSGHPGVPAPVPLFTFGLDMELLHSPQNSLLPSSCPGCPGLEPEAKGEESQKPPLFLEQTTGPLGDDLGSGIVYSALTCHLCGHLKQCDSQEERDEAHVVSSPCCGCRCGDRSEPPVRRLRGPDPLPGGVPLEGKSSLFFQPDPSNAQSPSQTPDMAAVLPAGPTCTSVS
ncbi:interleukin-4 receptor subunit alpha [Pteronotus mesoamericanus]|uniref:interleukin-4 receptor subunit alpha n=1 Tax=Pteronotus mesoamericanus TaxID=1884717 RepID=UPI0023ED73E5|nr:interleukin-4 receptor subunit alpha [Pteronotus parnellii mesoamericanus]